MGHGVQVILYPTNFIGLFIGNPFPKKMRLKDVHRKEAAEKEKSFSIIGYFFINYERR